MLAVTFFLMPSAFEPCGLSQLMAMRYGTLPIVHETGGLRDTVQPYNQYTGEGTGYSFNRFDGWTMLQTIYYALDVYYNQPGAHKQLVEQAMTRDFSWTGPTKEYLALYHSLLQG